MFKRLKKGIARMFASRTIILGIIFVAFGCILISRLFHLQIINGESYQSDFTMQIRKETSIPSTRGCIFDSAGNLLAYNKLSYDVTFQDVGSYETTRERNLTINGYLYKIMQILYANGDDIYSDFAIAINDAGEYEYTKNGVNLLRFKADVFGQPYTEDLTTEQAAITAEDMIKELGDDGEFGYGVLIEYTPEEREQYGLPDQLSKEDALKLISLRSAINQNSYQKYIPTTIAKDISDTAVSSLMESKGYYKGVDVVESSIRVYNESTYFANIIGYTGQISREEMKSLNEKVGRDAYDTTDIVGKTGLEQYFETELQGTDGKRVVYVNNRGNVLKEESRVEPQTGNNLYLTINTDWQKAAYHLLEQYIAGIVYSITYDLKEVDNENVSADNIVVPVYDIYYNLFENHVLSVSHMESSAATQLEKEVYQLLQQREVEIFDQLEAELISESPKPYKELPTSMQVYMTYLTETTLPELGLMKVDSIDTTDDTYLAWTKDESISLREYLTYAISKNWLDVSGIMEESEFWDSDEIFTNLCNYLEEYVKTDRNFSRKVYKYMVEDDTLKPSTLCMLLYDQGILEMDEEMYSRLKDGSLSAFEFIKEKIYTLELSPAQLAVAPYSGSLVVVDPNNGNTLACVTYPGYDNNRLANEMDDEYFEQLNLGKASPFYNKATQELTAPGSTYKMVSAVAGLNEGVISVDETIQCTGSFDLEALPIKCWIHPGNHGYENLVGALADSCNMYFNTVGFRLGDVGAEDGKAVDEVGIEKLAKYAAMFGFDQETGIEMDESAPMISDNSMARSAMGQGRNAFSTVQLARYVATVANSGTCYDLTLLDKITDFEGRTVMEKEPVIHDYVEGTEYMWSAIHMGMNEMVNRTEYLKDTGVSMAGKTGTAEQTGVPNHALYVGYAPYEAPEIAIACRITNGYSSKNAALLAKDMIRYIFGLGEKEELITGHATIPDGGVSGVRTD